MPTKLAFCRMPSELACGGCAAATCLEYLRKDLAEFFELSEIPASYRPRFNVAPTTPILVIKEGENGSREAVEMRWGLIPSVDASGRPVVRPNARAETVATKPAIREAFARRRCLIPASGQTTNGQKLPAGAKQPFFITDFRWHLPVSGKARPRRMQAPQSSRPRLQGKRGPIRRQDARHGRDARLVVMARARPETGRSPAPISSAHEEGSLRASPVSTRVNSARNDDPGFIATN